MRCRACNQDHPPLMRCEQWKRLQVMANGIQPLANRIETVANSVANKNPDMANEKGRDSDIRGTTYRYRDQEKRRAYQRELMRKRRGA